MTPERPVASPERVEDASVPFNVGLLGFGTVGSAFATLLGERVQHIGRLTGRLPVLGEALTTSKGDFAQILESSDLIVELIGGIEPAREYVLAALQAGKHVVTANKQLLSQHGEELLDAGASKRDAAALRGCRGGRRPSHPCAVRVARRRTRRAYPRDSQRHYQLHLERDDPRLIVRAGACRGPAPRLCRG